MANGNTAPSRLGAINGASDKDALFLKVFANEILTTFDEFNVMKDLHTIRTISSGKSAQFPVTGTATAKYHTPGQSIIDSGNSYLSDIKHAERVITIDDVLVSSTFIANIDELKNHYDVRSIYAKELGKALAKRFDIATMKTLAGGARQTATITGGKAGVSTNHGTALDTAPEIIDALYTIARKLDENDVPDDGSRFAILTPTQYYKLITSDNSAISLATNRDAGGVGNIATGRIPMVAGLNLYKSNHLVDVAVADGSQDQDDDNAKNEVHDANSDGTLDGDGYNADLSDTGFLAGHPSGIGTVKLLDLATESDYSVAHQGTLFVAKYAMGHNVLRPEACAEARK